MYNLQIDMHRLNTIWGIKVRNEANDMYSVSWWQFQMDSADITLCQIVVSKEECFRCCKHFVSRSVDFLPSKGSGPTFKPSLGRWCSQGQSAWDLLPLVANTSPERSSSSSQGALQNVSK